MMAFVLYTIGLQALVAGLVAGVALVGDFPGLATGFCGGMAVATLEVVLLALTARVLTKWSGRAGAVLLPLSLLKFALLGLVIWALMVPLHLALVPLVSGFSAGLLIIVLYQVFRKATVGKDEQAE
jgi:hypothetical protein